MIKKNNKLLNGLKLAELHMHVGGSVDPASMWSIAHSQGIKLPTKDFWQFVSLITVKGKKIKWQNYHQLFHWTELIQSSPEAMERSVYEIISGAYRNCNITLLEVSFNPMFRNRKGERDLDHIIMASIHGMDKALLEYPVQAGLVFILDKRLCFKLNKIIVKKAIKYQNKGVVGIDFAGPKANGFSFKDYSQLYKRAKKAGLGLAVHAGEEGSVKELEQAIDYLEPDRVIHGIKTIKSPRLLQKIRKHDIVLALCPTSNIKTGVVKNVGEFAKIIKIFLQEKIHFCINTDGPEMLKTNLQKEYEFLLKNKILTKKQIIMINKNAFKHSFIK